MHWKKGRLIREAAQLYALGVEVETARSELRRLAESGVSYAAPEMLTALRRYQDLNERFSLLEQAFLEHRDQKSETFRS